MRTTLVLGVAILLGSATAGWSADAKANWEKHCAKCHGTDGKGQTAMGKKLKVKDYSDAKFQAELREDHAVKVMKEGKKDGDKVLMKSYSDSLSEQEMKDLVAFIRTLKK